MSLRTAIISTLAACMLYACSPENSTSPTRSIETPPYHILDKQLTRLKADFNAMADRVRLVFIVGPSCGICLRGMDDLNKSIVASIQADPRAHTLVIDVPTLGAQERHVAASIPLLEGPRITHYWDPGGRSGLVFQETLELPVYAWDVWMIYEPGVRWEQDPPPAPAVWQHQLGSVSAGRRLDPDGFADAVIARLAKLPPAIEAAKIAETVQRDPGIIRVAQPRGFMIQHHHNSRGGYATLKTISAIRYEGETEIDGSTHALSVETRRPHYYRRTITDGAAASTVSWDGAQLSHEGAYSGLPAGIQDEILVSHDFDGWLTDWKEKGHQVWRLGMRKYAGRLPWLMEAELTNGRTWHVYIDSHSGDVFRVVLVDADELETIALEYDDFRQVDGFRLPHQIRYFEGDRLLAVDRFHDIEIEVETTAGR